MKVQSLTDAKGRKTAVQIPIKECERIRAKLDKGGFFDNLEEAMHEAKLYEEGKISLKPAKDLLNEL